MRLLPFVLGLPPLCAILLAPTLLVTLACHRQEHCLSRHGAPMGHDDKGDLSAWRKAVRDFLAQSPLQDLAAWKVLPPATIIAGLTLLGAIQPESGTTPAPSLLGISVSSFVPPLLLLSAYPSSLRSDPTARPHPLRSLLDGLRYGGAAILLALPFAYLAQHVFEPLGIAEEQPLVQWLASGKLSPAVAAIGALGAVFAAPFAEELFFRATLLPALSRGGRRPVRAALLSSLLFSALHGSLLALLPLFVASLLFSTAYLGTRRLAVAVVAHTVFNLYGLAAILLE